MKILLLTLGSRRDVQPFVALGQALKQHGWAAQVCTSDCFRPFTEQYGLSYAYMNSGLIALAEDPEARRALEGSKRKALALIKKVGPIFRKTLHEAWAAAQGADAIVYHPKALAGHSLAEKLGIPGFLSLPAPLHTPTDAFPNPLFPKLKLSGPLNRLSYSVNRWGSALYSGVLNKWRQSVLGLPKRSLGANDLVLPSGKVVPTLYSYRPHVVPQPEDWPESTHATGYWFLDEGYANLLPEDLTAFLSSGAPPVYIGFGSIAGSRPVQTTAVVLEALLQTRQRGILATGWGGLEADTLPDGIFELGAAPHDQLLAAAVHYGGAGTTAAGLRAGVTNIVCPYFGDQTFWGERVRSLGVSPAPLPQKTLTADALAQAIRVAMTDEGMKRRAHKLGQQLRAEDGLETAVQLISTYVTNHSSSERTIR